MHTIALDDNTQNVYPPFVFTVNFDYSQFENGELQSKAKTTLNQFIGFVRQTFDGLLIDGKLINLSSDYYFIISILWESICVFITLLSKFAAISKGRKNWRLPLEPQEYCRKWVPIYQGKKPGERGYRAACVRELAKISGVKESTIDINWGSDFSQRPGYLPRMLTLADVINSVKQIFPLPQDWPFDKT